MFEASAVLFSACPLWAGRHSKAQRWDLSGQHEWQFFLCPVLQRLEALCSVTVSDWIVLTRENGVAGVRTGFSETSFYFLAVKSFRRSQWPHGLRRRSTAARLLILWVRIPAVACMSVVSVVCCHVEVSATDWSLVQRSPTDCGASLSVIQKVREWGGPGLLGAVAPNKKERHSSYCRKSHNALVSLFNHSVVIQDHNKISVTA